MVKAADRERATGACARLWTRADVKAERPTQSVFVYGFELACATKSCALREVRSRTAHCEVSTGANAIQKSNLLPRCSMLGEDRRAITRMSASSDIASTRKSKDGRRNRYRSRYAQARFEKCTGSFVATVAERGSGA